MSKETEAVSPSESVTVRTTDSIAGPSAKDPVQVQVPSRLSTTPAGTDVIVSAKRNVPDAVKVAPSSTLTGELVTVTCGSVNFHNSSPTTPLSAGKNNWLSNSTNSKKVSLASDPVPTAEWMSSIKMVPLCVPSLIQSSRPDSPSSAEKTSLPWNSVRPSG